jgi:hypothetical protein
MAESSGETWETTDMSMAAWLLARRRKLVSLSAIPERRKEFRFLFEDRDGQCGSIALEFLNSDAHSFDTSMRSLKKMCFGPNGVRSAISSRR